MMMINGLTTTGRAPGWILLRDIPKDRVQLDLLAFDVQGGFRGFAQVFPGLHYVALLQDDETVAATWLDVPPGAVVIRVYEYESRELRPDTPENAAFFEPLARGGAMNRALISPIQRDATACLEWTRLTEGCKTADVAAPLHHEVPVRPPAALAPEELVNWYATKHESRFEQALQGTHAGNGPRLLAEFRAAFLRALVEGDARAQTRWRELFLAITNAGERRVAEHAEFFAAIGRALVVQAPHVPLTWREEFQPQLAYLLEDVAADVNVTAPGLPEIARELRAAWKSAAPAAPATPATPA